METTPLIIRPNKLLYNRDLHPERINLHFSLFLCIDVLCIIDVLFLLVLLYRIYTVSP